jgi:excisionase family DNA binding protein
MQQSMAKVQVAGLGPDVSVSGEDQDGVGGHVVCDIPGAQMLITPTMAARNSEACSAGGRAIDFRYAARRGPHGAQAETEPNGAPRSETLVNIEPHNQLAETHGSSFTITEAAELLGMPQTLLSRFCDDGRIPSVDAGSNRRIDADTVQTILHERARIKTEARNGLQNAEERRRIRRPPRPGPERSTVPPNH